MFNVVPVLLLALVVWLDRGLPRPPGLAAAAALLPVALFLTLPYATFFTIALDNSTFGLIPLERLGERLGGDQADTQVVVAAGMLLAGLLFASVPREVARLAIPVVLLTFLTISTISVFGRVDVVSTHARHAGGLHGDPSWIDHAIGENARAEFLYTTAIDRDPHALWQTEFWNESVRRVSAVTSQDPSIPDVDTWVDPGTGRIIPILRRDSPDHAPRYAVSTHNVEVAGSRLERNGFLVLYRVSPPLRLASLATGIDPMAGRAPRRPTHATPCPATRRTSRCASIVIGSKGWRPRRCESSSDRPRFVVPPPIRKPGHTKCPQWKPTASTFSGFRCVVRRFRCGFRWTRPSRLPTTGPPTRASSAYASCSAFIDGEEKVGRAVCDASPRSGGRSSIAKGRREAARSPARTSCDLSAPSAGRRSRSRGR